MAQETRKHLIVFLSFAATSAVSCKSRTQGSADATLDQSITSEQGNSENPYETVNAKPQLSVDHNQFSFYWGLWRTVTPSEKLALTATADNSDDGATAGSLVSRRAVVWTVHDCATSALLNRDHEELYYLDELEFNTNGEVIPVREAYRPGWRYFSMATFDSTLARTDLSMPVVEQLPGERPRDWRNRKFEVEQAWRREQSRRGQRGEIRTQATHRLYAVPPAKIRSSFVSFYDYRSNDSQFQGGVFARLNPNRWPVYFDERAHKSHSAEEPEIWRTGKPVSSREFDAVLKWDWCDSKVNVKAVFDPGVGGLPRPGPNRPGRNDAGNAPLEIQVSDQGLTKKTQ